VKAETGDDAATGVHILNVTYYSGVIITNPDNIFVMSDAVVTKYHRGLGSGFFTREKYNPKTRDYGDDTDSFFVFAIPRNESIVANPVTLTGHYNWVTSDGYPAEKEQVGNSLTHSTAPWYSAYWGFWEARYGTGTLRGYNSHSRDYFIPNETCFKSYSQQYNPRTKTYSYYTSQTGHWRWHTVGPGCARAREAQGSFTNPLAGPPHGFEQICP
jgi:hypothetical protein